MQHMKTASVAFLASSLVGSVVALTMSASSVSAKEAEDSWYWWVDAWGDCPAHCDPVDFDCPCTTPPPPPPGDPV